MVSRRECAKPVLFSILMVVVMTSWRAMSDQLTICNFAGEESCYISDGNSYEKDVRKALEEI